MVAREIETADAHERGEWLRLGALLGSDDEAPGEREARRAALLARNEELARRIRAGEADAGPWRAELLAHLRRTRGRQARGGTAAPPGEGLSGEPARARSGGSTRKARRDAAHRDREGVRTIVLARPAEYNTITPALRDELAAAIDDADADRDVHVILLRAEGRAFCAGYGLDWSTAAQAEAGRRAKRAAAEGRPRLGLGRRPAHDDALRRHLHEALVRAEADHRRGAGLVHRRRHRHGAVRRPDRRRRERQLRLPAVARLGHADDGDVGLPHGSRAGEALPADRRRDPGARRPREIGLILEVGARRRARGARDRARRAHGARCR